MKNAHYRKYNDGSHNSSKYHKLDGTSIRNILKQESKKEVEEYLTELKNDVEVRDGWYYVADIATVDGNPWVCEAEFLEIAKKLLDK